MSDKIAEIMRVPCGLGDEFFRIRLRHFVVANLFDLRLTDFHANEVVVMADL